MRGGNEGITSARQDPPNGGVLVVLGRAADAGIRILQQCYAGEGRSSTELREEQYCCRPRALGPRYHRTTTIRCSRLGGRWL